MARLARVVVPGHPHHVTQRGKDDGLTALAPIRDRFPRFADLLDLAALNTAVFDRLRAAESIGRPLGDSGFFSLVERMTRRRLRPQKRGRKPTRRPTTYLMHCHRNRPEKL